MNDTRMAEVVGATSLVSIQLQIELNKGKEGITKEEFTNIILRRMASTQKRAEKSWGQLMEQQGRSRLVAEEQAAARYAGMVDLVKKIIEAVFEEEE